MSSKISERFRLIWKRLDQSVLRPIGSRLGNERLEFWFVVPTFLTLLALIVFPMLWSLWTSFTDLNLAASRTTGEFVGLENYIGLVTDGEFWNSILNTAYFVGFGVLIEFILGFAIALIMANYTSRWISRILFTSLLIPMMMAPIVAGYMWRLLFLQNFGPVNYLLGIAGLPQPLWLSSPKWALTAILVADIWQWTPLMILILYTGRLAVSEDLYEAARVDGASRWFIFRHVTVPQMKGVIAVAILIRSMDAFKFFDKMFIMTGGGPGNASELATYFNYLLGFRAFAMGKATAMSWLLVIIAIILANLFLLILERTEGGESVV